MSNLSTVHVEPPVADEILLVEQGAVRAEKSVFVEVIEAKICTNVEDLTFSISVRVVALY